eukprot:CAMPEP_0174848862 /NCGR_PEP_ID=MMETSP1114-20130205/13775_1 /TAXON_ID=312471 /ORGANISM="Neobodo designis, Strain CCAP 1951/1" /LENGTH=835 /DNA_ID=CAMNT_0016083167 /DNA_START=158 /DNA_END=2661 /DNA_ORIENTATION=-
MSVPAPQAGEAFVTITRLLALSVVLLVVNITEGIEHGRANTLAIVASVLSLVLGAVGVVDRVLRAVVTTVGFIAVEWLQIVELLIVSALCTAITVEADREGGAGDAVSVAMALTTALLIRVDLTLVVRVASAIYFEKLLAAANEGDDVPSNSASKRRPSTATAAFEASGLGRSTSLNDSTRSRIFDVEDMEDIDPPRVSAVSVLLVHLLAAIALPAPVVGAFVVAADGNAVVIGHLVSVLVLAWVRVGHSFVLATAQVRAILGSTADDDEQLHELSTASPGNSTMIPQNTTRAFGDDNADGTATTTTNEPFGGLAQRGTSFESTNTAAGMTVGELGLRRHDTVGNLASTSNHLTSLHTLSTTQTFRNKALSVRNKDEVRETVRESKPTYRLGTVLGRGGFSTVYAAMNSKTGELMAAKKLQFPSDDDETERRIAMLQNEVSLMRALDHPHVIKYLFCDQPEPVAGSADADVEVFFIVMEYVGGGSLHDLVKNFGALGDEASASFVAQVLLGVEYLHTSGRVHRDMKPGNVLLRSDGHVKISDFGTSLDLTDRGAGDDIVSGFRIDHMAGTPLYSPPEALKGTLARARNNGKNKDNAAGDNEDDGTDATVDEAMAYSVAYDIWGIGCTAMELLTGKRPWAHLSGNALKSLTMLVDEATAIEEALEADEWESGGGDGTEAPVRTCPTLPPGLSDNARSFLESCLKVDPMARLNATALLCHPWIQQYDLIDTKTSPLHGFVPLAVETGVLDTRADAKGRRAAQAEAKLSPEQKRMLNAGIAVAASSGGSGRDPTALHPRTVRAEGKSNALDAAQAAYADEKERDVRQKMNRAIHKTRA